MTVTVYRFVWIHVDGADIEVVVHILRGAGCDALKRFFDVSQEERLGFLEDNRHSGMHGLDIDHTVFDAIFLDNGGNFFGDIDEVERCVGAQTDNVIDDFHRNSGRGRMIRQLADAPTKGLIHNHGNGLQTGDGGGDAVCTDACDDVVGAFVMRGVLFDNLR